MAKKPDMDEATKEVVKKAFIDYFTSPHGKHLLADYTRQVHRVEFGVDHNGHKLTDQQMQVSVDAVIDYNESATNIILSKLTETHKAGAGAMEFSIADILKFIGIIAGSL